MEKAGKTEAKVKEGRGGEGVGGGAEDGKNGFSILEGQKTE